MNRLFIGILLRNITEHASFLMNRYQKILYMRDGVDQVSKKKKNFEIRYSKSFGLVGLRNTVCRTTFSSCSSRYYTPNRYVLVQQNAHLKRKRFFFL